MRLFTTPGQRDRLFLVSPPFSDPDPVARSPFWADAAQVYHTGAVAAEVYHTGAQAAQVYHTGAQAAQVFSS